MREKTSVINRIFKMINMHGGDESVCWEWKGKVNKGDGRPYTKDDNGKNRPAYSIVLEAFSPPSGPGLSVLHSCDNPICCNPHHLHWGTHQENMNEMKERDRHGMPAHVRNAIKKLAEKGRTHAEIADLYGLERSTVTKICNREGDSSGEETSSNEKE